MTDADYKTIAEDVRYAAVALRNKIAAARNAGMSISIDTGFKHWLSGADLSVLQLIKFTRIY